MCDHIAWCLPHLCITEDNPVHSIDVIMVLQGGVEFHKIFPNPQLTADSPVLCGLT